MQCDNHLLIFRNSPELQAKKICNGEKAEKKSEKEYIKAGDKIEKSEEAVKAGDEIKTGCAEAETVTESLSKNKYLNMKILAPFVNLCDSWNAYFIHPVRYAQSNSIWSDHSLHSLILKTYCI